MSLLVSTAINDMQTQLTIIGQSVGTADFILYLNKVIEFYSNNYDLPTARRYQDLLLYPGVNEYQLNSDFAALCEPERPYPLFSPNFTHETKKELIHWKHGKLTAVEFDRDTPFLVANTDCSLASLVDGCEDTSYVTLSGDGSGLIKDTQIFTEGTGSLRFTVTASGGTTTLTFALPNQIDITDFVTNGSLFLDLDIPDTNTTALTSVGIRIGSDASNYYSVTSTTRYRGNSLLGGWGLIGFNLLGATQTGTVVQTAVDYLQVTITTGLTGVNGIYRLDNVFLSTATYYQLPYYSVNNVLAANGTYKELVTDTDDTILTPPKCEGAFVYKCLEMLAAERLRKIELATYFSRELIPRENGLKANYPRQSSRRQLTWYKRANSF